MSRLIVLGLVIAAVVWVARRMRTAAGNTPRPADRFEPTVRCRQCGAYVVTSQAITDASGRHRCAVHGRTPDEERVS